MAKTKVDDLEVSGEITTSGNSVSTTVSGNTLIVGTLTVSSTVAATGAATIGGTLTATGTTTMKGNAIVGGTLAATGNTTLGGTLAATGNTTIGGMLAATGNTTVGGTFTATGNTIIGGTLTATGNTTVVGTLAVTGNVQGSPYGPIQIGDNYAMTSVQASATDVMKFRVQRPVTLVDWQVYVLDGATCTGATSYKVTLNKSLAGTGANLPVGTATLAGTTADSTYLDQALAGSALTTGDYLVVSTVAGTALPAGDVHFQVYVDCVSKLT